MAQEIPAELQQQVQQLQALNQQLQASAQQRQQFEAMLAENQRALRALKELAEDAPVYRNVGALLVRENSKGDAEVRLADEVETLELRVKRVKSQEEQLRGSFQALQTKLEAAFSAPGPAPGGKGALAKS